MFRKFITLMMVAAIFTVQANAATNNNLKAAFDELNYSLTVEWDQKDKSFYDEQMVSFSKTLRELQAKGLTNEQLVDFVKTEIKNEKVARDIEFAFNMIEINKMHPTDASKFMVDTMKKSYSAGASWNGDVVVYLAIGLLIVAVAVAVSSGSSSSSSGSGGGYCEEYYYCPPCYWDYYGSYVCPSCYMTCY